MPQAPWDSINFPSSGGATRAQGNPSILAAELLRQKLGIEPTKEKVDEVLTRAKKLQQKLNSSRSSVTSLSACVREVFRSHHKKSFEFELESEFEILLQY